MSTNPVARPQSRRGLLTAALLGTAAGTATFGVGAALGTQVAAAKDDPVLSLVAVAKAESQRYDEAIDATFEAVFRHRRDFGGTPQPEGALLEQPDDYDLELHGSVALTKGVNGPRTFSQQQIERFRAYPRKKYGEEPHPNMPPPNMRQTISPWPQADARAKEIVAAWDAMQAETERRRQAAGLPEAERAEKEAEKRFKAACRAATEARATSLSGIIAKASFVAGSFGDHDIELSDLIQQAEAPQSDETWGWSIIRDLAVLGGQA